MKYGVKVSIIDELDYEDFKTICDAIQKLGYSITIADNGNAICEKSTSKEGEVKP